MKKKYRIKKYSEIDAVYRKRDAKNDSYFAVYQANDPEAKNFRFAMSIGTKYGNAVQRNLIKRRVRMIVSDLQDQFIINKLFLIVIRPKAKQLDYQEIKSKLTLLLKKSKLMENKNAKTL
ncbi:ribonuclease P protein component [Mariniplasma anaerobium]|uniref:Ribonuclease P protein component n=1 Tax=Mariniplasma anaerobium TaxID=2735436 RepID=A0A7U9THG8_9MOLU|nr:ribonuclease P protein component [Mariniplasma anaerobium]BCR36876.1 ribonuclease P protein component [Mariniplasma anaerobium]